MKIFHVLHGFPPELTGGTERTVEALGTAMRARGHEVVVVAGSLERAPTARADAGEHAGLRVLRLHRDDLYYETWDKSWSPGVSDRFAELVDVEKPDVVHVHHWIRLTSDLARIARRAGAVTAVTLHDYYTQLASPVRRIGDDEPHPPQSPRWMNRNEVRECFALHRGDFLDEIRVAHLRFAPSEAHARGVQELADGPLGPVRVSTPPLLKVPPRRDAAAPERGRTLVLWGSLYPEKGIETVLDALVAVGGGWQLEVFGDAHEPGYRDLLRQRAGNLPVTWHGPRFDVDELAKCAADYAILPSTCHESYGLTLDEALCIGLPLIASELPAYRERAPERSCAFFAPGDAGALAMILCDDARLGALRAPSPPSVTTPQRAADELLELYEQARTGEHKPYVADVRVTDRARAAHLFRRCERRLWTALQQEDPRAPEE